MRRSSLLLGVGGWESTAKDLIVVPLLGEELLVVGVTEQLTAPHRKGYHAEGTVALAAFEAGLVDDLTLNLELLHHVNSFATCYALVTTTTRHVD